MTHGYASTLARCILLSAVGMSLILVSSRIPPVIPFIFGLAPLFWYHLAYLRPRAKKDGLSQAAIDSVYYYGFLVTIAALGITAVQMSLRGNPDFLTVAFQFGLGVLATGYAVGARLDLTAASRLIEEASPEEVMDRYVQRSRELVTNVELASSSFRTFAESLTREAVSFSARAQAETHASIKVAADAFGNEIASMAKGGTAAIVDLRAVVNDVTFGAEREEMRKSVRSIANTVTNLNKSMESLAVSTYTSAGSVSELATSLAGARDHAADFSSHLARLGGSDGAIAKIAAAVETSSATLEGASNTLSRTWDSLNGIAGQIEGTVEALAGMEELAADARAKVAALAGALAKVDGLSVEVHGAAASLGELGAQAAQSGAAAAALSQSVVNLQSTLAEVDSALAESASGLKQSMAAASTQIHETLETSTRSAALVASKLGSIADFIIDRTQRTGNDNAAV